jgi:hypothetical protein
MDRHTHTLWKSEREDKRNRERRKKKKEEIEGK